MALPVPLAMQFETPESFAFRVAAANGFPTANLFFKLTKISRAALSKGDPDAIGRLSSWSGIDPAEIGRYAAVKVSRDMTWRMGSAVFNKEARAGRRVRYCPCCVVADLDEGTGRVGSRPYVRPSWNSRTVRNCAHHQRPILEASLQTSNGFDFCEFVRVNGKRIRLEASKTCSADWTDLDRYCENRIRGILEEHYLDSLEAHVAIDLCIQLGDFIKRYRSAVDRLPTDIRAAPARELGFHVARRGEDAIREIVVHVLKTEIRRARGKFIFGRLGRWLRGNSERAEFAPVVDLFQTTVVKTLPFATGEMCFVPVDKRRVHSVRSAALQYRMSSRRVIELLAPLGLIDDPGKHPGLVFFDVERSEPVLDAAACTLTSKEVRAELHLSEKTVAAILGAGLIKRVETRSEGRIYSRVRREDLDDFLRRIFSHVAIGHVDPQWVTIDAMCQIAQCTKDVIISLMLDGSLTQVAAPPDHDSDLDALRFDPASALEVTSSRHPTISEIAGEPVMNQRDAALYLRVKTDTVPYLLKSNLLPSMRIKNSRSNRHQLVIRRASLDAFREKFVQVSEVAADYDTHTNIVLEAFAKVGIHPIYEDRSTISRFFRKADLANITADVPRPKRRRRKKII